MNPADNWKVCKTGGNILRNQGKHFPVLKRDLQHFGKANFHYIHLHIDQRTNGFVPGKICMGKNHYSNNFL